MRLKRLELERCNAPNSVAVLSCALVFEGATWFCHTMPLLRPFLFHRYHITKIKTSGEAVHGKEVTQPEAVP